MTMYLQPVLPVQAVLGVAAVLVVALAVADPLQINLGVCSHPYS